MVNRNSKGGNGGQIWLASELFYPDEISTGYIMTQFAEHLAKDQKINVICGPSGYEAGTNHAVKPLNENIIVHRITVPKLNKNKVILRIIRMLLITVKMGWVIIRKIKKQDHLILVTNPASLLLFAGLIKSFKSLHYSLIVHDVFPENLIPSGFQKKGSFTYKILLKYYNKAYNAAERLYVLGEDMKNLVAKKIKKKNSISVIPNWAETDAVYPIEGFDKSAYLNIDVKDKIVIGFAGNIGRVQALEAFIEIFIKARNADLVLIIIGEGALKQKLQEIVKEQEVSNIHFIASKPRSEQVQFLNSCDIGLVSLSEGMYGLGVPSKVYNIMATAKPILFIGDKKSEVDLYIRQFDCGWSFDWSEKEQLLQFLSALHFNHNDLSGKGKNGYHAANRHFSRDIVLNKFQAILKNE